MAFNPVNKEICADCRKDLRLNQTQVQAECGHYFHKICRWIDPKESCIPCKILAVINSDFLYLKPESYKNKY